MDDSPNRCLLDLTTNTKTRIPPLPLPLQHTGNQHKQMMRHGSSNSFLSDFWLNYHERRSNLQQLRNASALALKTSQVEEAVVEQKYASAR
jgi:hypothetical protein